MKLGVEKGYKMIAGVRGDYTKYDDLNKLQAAHPDQVEILTLDVSNEESIIKAKEKVAELGLELHGIVNNAGVLV
ncbi:hypothetical protein AOA59_00030, partial [Pseudomonas sp. 2822-15]